LKILQILPFHFFGGPENQIFPLAGELQRRYQVTTRLILYHSPHLASEEKKLAELKAQQENIELEWRPSPRISQVFSEKKYLSSQLTSETLLVSSGYLCDLLAWSLPCKKISYFHGWTGQSWKVRVYEALDAYLLRQFDAIVCVSNAQKTMLEQKNSNTVVLSNAISTKGLPSARSRQDLLTKYSIPPDAKILLSLGRLSPEKGPHLALQTMKDLHDQNIYWVWIGGGPLLESLNQEKQSLGISRLIFAGHESSASGWLAAADVIVLPSYREGLPVTLLESLYHGRPVVAASVGGIPEVIQEGENGLLFKAGDHKQMQQKILKVLADPQLSARISSGARETLHSNYQIQHQTQKWHEIVESI
jgi:glycosyltransferase involved in cell wall biosynthesis